MIESVDIIDDLNTRYRVRLGGYVRGSRAAIGIIEWRDVDLGLKERLSFVDLSGLGWWLVMISADGNMAVLQKGSRRVIATSWPVEDVRGRVTEVRTDEIRG